MIYLYLIISLFLYVNSAQCPHIVKERERKYFRAKCEIQGLRFCQGLLGWYQNPCCSCFPSGPAAILHTITQRPIYSSLKNS
ncbi:hypothetical protein EV421DRAFT_1798112 [Armillaria borealis]|uniref:Secreted protein n=1 Tax=Armillaria borealis TaxID=47425 RepID=A0AA39JNY2_9AGAR|nr:hypothetical protein EV421DRAFT_1798112 [Armillaria borealis]